MLNEAVKEARKRQSEDALRESKERAKQARDRAAWAEEVAQLLLQFLAETETRTVDELSRVLGNRVQEFRAGLFWRERRRVFQLAVASSTDYIEEYVILRSGDTLADVMSRLQSVAKVNGVLHPPRVIAAHLARILA